MKLLGLLALVVAVSASTIKLPQRSEWLDQMVPKRHIEDKYFKPNREYQFFYNGQLATGIPSSSQQHSATRMQSLVSIIFQSEHSAMLQFREIRFGRRNEHIAQPRNILPFAAFEQIDVEQELMQTLKKPVKFIYRHGMIKDVEFDQTEQPWSANIKRGVLNLLQVNVEKKGEIENSQQLIKDNENKLESFKVMEPTLEGECETQYTFVSMPCRPSPLRPCRDQSIPVVNVTKSINFENCKQRPEIRYNERFQQICPTCEQRYTNEERLTRSQTVGQMNLICQSEERKKCLIERASIESQYNFVPYNEQANLITTYVNQTLELVKCGPIESEMPQLSSPIQSDTGLVFTQDWDVQKELFFMEGETEFQQNTPYSPLKNKVDFVKSILQKLVHYMNEQVQEEAPRQFTRLVKVLRMLTKDQIIEVHQKFFKSAKGFTPEEHKKIKDLLIDAIGLCGTHDCVKHLMHVIKTDQVSPIKGSFVVRKLMQARIVSPKMIEQLFELCTETKKCERHSSLKQAVYLTVGSMMRTLCSNNRNLAAVESKTNKQFCPTSLKEKFVQKIIQEFESTESQYERILLIKTLSNSGLNQIIKPLQKIIQMQQKQMPTVVRIEAILALRHLCGQIPNQVIRILMPIYMNRNEFSEVRTSALFQILQCQPSKPILDQIARSLKTERNHQVTSFTYTILQTMANSSIPCEKRVAEDLKLCLRMGRYVPVSRWMMNSKYMRLVNYYNRHAKTGIAIDLASVMSNTSVLPETFAIKVSSIIGGQWQPNQFNFGIRQSGIGRLLNRVVRGYSHNLQSSLEDLISGKFQLPSPKFNYRDELKQLFEQLNTVERSDLEFEPFGLAFMKVSGMEYGFMPLSKNTLPEEIKELLMSSDITLNKLVKRAERMLNDVSLPFSVHTGTFVYEMSRKIPTTIGFPLRVSLKMPTIMQASGTFKVEVDDKQPLKKVKLVVDDFKPSIMVSHVTKMEAWSPILNTGVKVVSQAKAFVPINAKLSIDMKKTPAEIKFSVAPRLRDQEEIVTVQSRPICFTLIWPKFLEQWQEPQEKTIHGHEWTRVKTHNVVFGQNSLGIKMHSRAYWHHRPQQHVPTTPSSVLAGVNKYSLTMQPGHEMPKEFVMRISGKVFKSFDKEITPKFNKFYEDSSEDFLSEESSEELEQSNIHQEYIKSYKGQYPVNNEFEVELFTTGSSIKRKAMLALNYMCDHQMKTCNGKIEIERTPIPNKESKPWKLLLNMKTLHPQTPFRIDEITSDKKFMSQIESKWGHQGNMNKGLNIKIVAEQSNQMLKLKEQSTYNRLYRNEQQRSSFRSLFSPVAQYKQTLKYGLLDEYKVDIDYQLPTQEQVVLDKVFRYVKHYYYPQSVVQNIGIQHPEGRVRAKFNIDPVNRRYLNVTIMTPKELVQLKDIPLPMPVNMINMRRLSTPSRSFSHLIRQWVTNSQQPICEIRTNRMTTFDGVQYDVPTSTCYSVLAKDCYDDEQSKFAILIKKQSHGSEKKNLKIVTPHTKLTMRAKSNQQIECELNGQKTPCSQLREVIIHKSHVVLSCQQYSEQYIGCELPEAGIRVYFDGFAANVKVSPVYRSQVCGLCGQFDLDMDNEWVNSRRSLVSRKQMFESFLAEQDSCQHEFPESQTMLSFDDDRFDQLPETINMPVRSSSQWDVRPIEKTKIIEQSHQLCFSKQPVQRCPRHTYPVEHESSKRKVVYACLPRNDIQAEIFQHRVQYERQVVSEVSELKSSFTETERVPKICRQF
jgi:hypothetical protein